MRSESIEDIHKEIMARVEKGGRFANVFYNWLKYENNGDRLLAAKGFSGENYLLNRLGTQEVKRALVIIQSLQDQWTQDRIDQVLNGEDSEGNGIWHYLADNLKMSEGRETLKIANLLIDFDVNFIKRNKKGISPLGKMLLPEPKWQSINALVRTRHLQIGNIESAISEYARDDEAKKAALMCSLFQQDLTDNKAILSQHVLKLANKSNTDPEHRQATCRLFFDYTDETDNTTAFFKLIRVANAAMFEDLLRLLLTDTDATILAMGPPDVATKKAYRQVVLCRRLLRVDRRGENVMFHCVRQGKIKFYQKIMNFLVNDDVAVKKMKRGEPVRTPVTIDKMSPAPANPLLSVLLKRNRMGDTMFHLAARKGDREALEAFCYGLPSNDIHAIFTRIPDAAGLTLMDMTQMEAVKAKLNQAIRAGRLKKEVAQGLLRQIGQSDKDAADFVLSKKLEIEELANDTKGGAPLAPNFDLKAAMGPSPKRTAAS